MIKRILTFLVIVLSLVFCTQEKKDINNNSQEMLEIALFHSIHHFQSESERALIKKHNIKSVSFVKNIMSKNKVDSTTYLTYDNEGRLKYRTTTECTTVGCLPYIIIQNFNYRTNKIIRMDNSTFKNKYNSTLDYWRIIDTNKLSKFDWEDYTYINDTIVVESGAFLKKYVKNANGNIIYEKNQPKTNNQVFEIVYKYSDSSIVVHGTNNYSDNTLSILYQINDKYKVVMKQTINDKTNHSKEFVFDARGLLAEILDYKNGHQMSKTKIKYSYF